MTQIHEGPVLVTGGAGFVGCNIAAALARRGQNVTVFDSFARHGAHENAHWLKSQCGDRIEIQTADIRDSEAVDAAVARASAVIHLAAQVAVTTSLDNPRDDFEINARGTLNVLEAVRQLSPAAPILFASTNKVYGSLFADARGRRSGSRCEPTNPTAQTGIGEEAPLDFHSPYGCSKGAADQYVRDYARVFGLRTAVMRMSCIYGPRQFGTEDQGWIAHFFLQALRHQPITIYGDGYQVRDALHVHDAVAGWLMVLDRIDAVSGQVFHLGGGAANSVSLRELLGLMREMDRHPSEIHYRSWRPGDQPWYISDIRVLAQTLSWKPRISLREGL